MAKEQVTNLSYYTSPLKDIKKAVNDFVDPAECLIGINYLKQQANPAE